MITSLEINVQPYSNCFSLFLKCQKSCFVPLRQQNFGLPMWITTYFFTLVQAMFLWSLCLITGVARIFSTVEGIYSTCPDRNYRLLMDHNLLLDLLENSTWNIHVLKYILLLSSSYLKLTVCWLNIPCFNSVTLCYSPMLQGARLSVHKVLLFTASVVSFSLAHSYKSSNSYTLPLNAVKCQTFCHHFVLSAAHLLCLCAVLLARYPTITE